MFKNYFTIAWRNITKNKLYSLINIGGLGVGMAVSFMLLLYVYNEFTFDHHHVKSDRLYRVFRNQPADGEVYTSTSTQVQLAGVLSKDFPEIEKTARSNSFTYLFNYADKGIKLPMLGADVSILDMFTFDFVKGDRQTVFKDVSSVVLTESAAKSFFGNQNPIGQTIKWDNKIPVKVTGVIKDHPQNSSFQFKALVSWAFLEAQQPWIKNSGWGNYSFRTYVLLKEGADVEKINPKVKHIVGKYDPSNKENEIFLYSFTKAHLYNDFKNGVLVGGSIEYVRLFMFLAIGILLIACINFMNLSTARSERRAREVGVRKVVGARRSTIIGQFLGESLLMSFLAFVLAVILMITLLPYFNGIINKNLEIPYHNVWIWVVAVGVTLITGVIAGSYPALYLSSFKPVKVLKGLAITSKATLRPRQVLVIIQFSFATCLILSTILIYKQVNYIKNRPAGYDKSGLVEITIEGKLYEQFENFRRDAISAGAITDAAITSGTITQDGSSSWGIKWPGQLAGEDKIPIDQLVTTYHFVPTFNVKLLEGHDFSEARPADTLALMLNEAAVKMMRLKQPLGQKVTWQGQERTVIGVVKDFTWGSPYEPVKPMIIGFMKDWANLVNVRLNSKASVSANMSKLEAIYKKYNPEYPFEYNFVDEGYESKFRTEKLLGTLSNSFTVLAIIISCLGLFALASFSAEQRRKEIGIRKVLGASTGSLWFNLSKEFIQLVLIAFIIGAAISWYFMDQWLAKYTYRTSVSAWVFFATIAISMAVCLVTVSWQAIKAAWMNPVSSLRSE